MDISLFESESKMKQPDPPTLELYCLLGMVALRLIFPLALFSNWLLLSLGIATIIFGIVMGVGAESQFKRSDTTVDHLGVATKLVSDGWFRYSRNPMYLSLALLLVGAWLALGSVSPLLGIIIYLVLTERWYIASEEKRLVAKFGSKYESYRSRTRRWI
jgi:protein-S-isoprenylcysteine O-methyltransferase Ste14